MYFSSFQKHVPDEFEALQKLKFAKYLANFSIFQSIPDAWSIDQLFPVMPLSHHEQKPTHKATIVDITCDSDGCLEKFIDRKDVRNVLELHPPNREPYYLGFFLVGAYQESLANEHNLFGAINEAEIVLNSQGKWDIVKTTTGDPVDELLSSRNYENDTMLKSFSEQLERNVGNGRISKEDSASLMERLSRYFKSSPYLLEES